MIFGGLLTGLILINLFAVYYIFDLSGNYITKTQCSSEKIQAVNYYLSYEYSTWQRFLFIYDFQLKLLIGAIAMGWILHGVGFRLF